MKMRARTLTRPRPSRAVDDAQPDPRSSSLAAAGPVEASLEPQAVEERLAGVPDEWKSPTLVSELRRAARAADAHRRLTEAHNVASVALAAALAADVPNIEAAADAHIRVEALGALRRSLDTPEWHPDVLAQITGAAAHRLVDPFRDVTFITLARSQAPSVHITRQHELISPNAEGRYTAIWQDAAAWVARTNRHLEERTARPAWGASVTVERTPDPVPWLGRTADLAREGASIIARAAEFEASYPPGAKRSPLFPGIAI